LNSIKDVKIHDLAGFEYVDKVNIFNLEKPFKIKLEPLLISRLKTV
jgi:hypothetical protein